MMEKKGSNMARNRLLIIRLFIFFIAFSSFSFAQDGKLYENVDGHFSFIIPDEWIEIPTEIANPIIEVMSQVSSRILELKYAAVFQEKNTYLPYMVLKIYKGGIWTEGEIDEYIAGDRFKQSFKGGIKEINDGSTNWVDEIISEEARYDENQYRLFSKQEAFVEGVGEVVAEIAVMLSNYGDVHLIFYTLKDRFKEDSAYFKQVINSFKFDKEYEYFPPELQVKDSSPIAFIFGLIFLVFILVVIEMRLRRTPSK
jgi:hypothetical protein